MQKKNQLGFGFLELLLVLGVIAMLALLILTAVIKSREKARDNSVRNDVRQMRLLAEEVYDSQGASYKNWAHSDQVSERLKTLLEDVDLQHKDEDTVDYLTEIRDTQNKHFCVSAPLVSDDGHYCVDASGVFATTDAPCPTDEEEPFVCPGS